MNKDIIVYHNEPDTPEIGFQRLSHSGGRFFVANITEENGNVILSEETKDIYPNQSPNKMFTTNTDTESEENKPSWDSAYKKLDLACGKLQSICDDDEDMLLITYEDGMQINVGYTSDDKTYRITVVASDTSESWSNPLGVFSLKDKSNLAAELQKAIYIFRNK